MKSNLFYLIVIMFLLFTTISMLQKENEQNKSDIGIFVHRFFETHTYPYSIDESRFWDEKDKELATIKLDESGDLDILKRDVLNMKRIEEGLSENFEYAFLIRKENTTDTIYADFILNLWTIKKKGEFIYYKDEKGKVKEVFQNYSLFFSECWDK